MYKAKFITYMLNELTKNEEDCKRFSSLSYLQFSGNNVFGGIFVADAREFFQLPDLYKEHVIRTCLSRIDGKAVLSGLEVSLNTTKGQWFEMHLEDCLLEFHTYTKVDKDVVKSATWAVKDLFREYEKRNKLDSVELSELLYQTFDNPLREGKPLSEALFALDEKFEELNLIK